jgi:hypothetical protein
MRERPCRRQRVCAAALRMDPCPLTPEELRAKRAALRRYRTQMDAMRSFLESFARSNEVFSRPAPTRVVLPTRSSPCCDR